MKAFTDKEGDNRILNAVLHLQNKRAPRSVVLITKDINMRLRAKGAGVRFVEDYRTDQLIDDVQYLTKGFQTRPGNFWDKVDSVDSYSLGGKTFHKLDREPFEPTYINQYVLDEESDFAARVETITEDKITLLDLSRERMLHRKAWDITPKNIYQGMALDALLDPDIDLVILTGAAVVVKRCWPWRLHLSRPLRKRCSTRSSSRVTRRISANRLVSCPAPRKRK